MSLNTVEQRLREYVEAHPVERQHWNEKVREMARTHPVLHDAARRLETELQHYLRERVSLEPVRRKWFMDVGAERLSLRSLAEYWLRLWTPPRPKRPAAESSNYF
jgi:hypothetical protein